MFYLHQALTLLACTILMMLGIGAILRDMRLHALATMVRHKHDFMMDEILKTTLRWFWAEMLNRRVVNREKALWWLLFEEDITIERVTDKRWNYPKRYQDLVRMLDAVKKKRPHWKDA